MNTKMRNAVAATAAVLLAGVGFASASMATPDASAPAPVAAEQPLQQARWGGGDRVTLPVRPFAQDEDQWCWAATGLMITRYFGQDDGASQEDFCNAGNGRRPGSWCPNEPRQPSNVQRGFRAFGVAPGRSTGPLSFREIQRNIDNGSPIPVGYYWRAGGGHMVHIAGYDASYGEVLQNDPWPYNRRSVWFDYDYFRSNSDWRWAVSLSGVGAGGRYLKPAADLQEQSRSLQAEESTERGAELRKEPLATPGGAMAITPAQDAALQAAMDERGVAARAERLLVSENRADGPSASVSDATTKVFSLNPEFVRGASATPAVERGVARLVTGSNGDRATVTFVPSGAGLRYAMTASGDDELRYAGQAGRGIVFREPQTNSWFRLENGRVTPLNAAARATIGRRSISVAAYQDNVQGRFGDELPGSLYQARNLFG